MNQSQETCLTPFLLPAHTTYAAPVDEGMVLLNAQTSECVGLNALASLLWERFSSGATMADVMEQMQQQYDVDPNRLQRDLQAFLDEMQHKGLLVPASHPASSKTPVPACRPLPRVIRLLVRINRLLRVPLFEWLEAFWVLHYVERSLLSRGLVSIPDLWKTFPASHVLSHEESTVRHLAHLELDPLLGGTRTWEVGRWRFIKREEKG